MTANLFKPDSCQPHQRLIDKRQSLVNINKPQDFIDDSQASINKETLLKHPKLWRAGELLKQQQQSQAALATGFTELDQYLPDHGWPAGGLVELLLANSGVGELRLLLPVLRTLTQGLTQNATETQSRWVAWVNPPFTPYAPALQAAGVDVDRILLIHPEHHKDALWAVERISRSGVCGAVFAWLDEKKLKSKDTQRLQLAARQGGTLSCLFRPQAARRLPSMAELRLALKATARPGVSSVDIVKRRGGWPVSGIELAINAVSQTGYQPRNIQEQLALWRALFERKEQERKEQDRKAAQERSEQARIPTPRGRERTVRLH